MQLENAPKISIKLWERTFVSISQNETATLTQECEFWNLMDSEESTRTSSCLWKAASCSTVGDARDRWTGR